MLRSLGSSGQKAREGRWYYRARCCVLYGESPAKQSVIGGARRAGWSIGGGEHLESSSLMRGHTACESDTVIHPRPSGRCERHRRKARDPVRRAKIAAARRGKPRPRHVIEAMIAGRLAKPVSLETRRKMS